LKENKREREIIRQREKGNKNKELTKRKTKQVETKYQNQSKQ
jgi:hypothetical protein